MNYSTRPWYSRSLFHSFFPIPGAESELVPHLVLPGVVGNVLGGPLLVSRIPLPLGEGVDVVVPGPLLVNTINSPNLFRCISNNLNMDSKCCLLFSCPLDNR